MYNNNPYYGNSSNAPQSFMNSSVLDNYVTKSYLTDYNSANGFIKAYDGDITVTDEVQTIQLDYSGYNFSEVIYWIKPNSNIPATSSGDVDRIVAAVFNSTYINGISILNTKTYISTANEKMSYERIIGGTTEDTSHIRMYIDYRDTSTSSSNIGADSGNNTYRFRNQVVLRCYESGNSYDINLRIYLR